MKRAFVAATLAVALLLGAGWAFALDTDVLRDIRRADTTDELAKLAEELAERTASPEREARPVPSVEDLKVYLQLIQIKIDAVASAKSDKHHAEMIKELKK